MNFGQAQNISKELEFTYPYTNYTIEDGLPSNETYYSLIDSKGYLWVSTDKGVSRFNGYEFENFTTADGLIDNTIFNIYEDVKGQIWFIGYNNKLCLWNWQKHEFTPYTYNDTILSNFSSADRIKDFAIDSNGNVIIGFVTKGYIVINESGQVTERNNKISHFGWIIGLKTFNNEFIEYGCRNTSFINRSVDSDSMLTLEVKKDQKVIESFAIPRNEAFKIVGNTKYGIIQNSYTSFYYSDSLKFFQQLWLQFIAGSESMKANVNENFVYYETNESVFALINNDIFYLNDQFKPIKKILNISINELSKIYSHENLVVINSTSSGIYILNLKTPISNLVLDKFKVSAIHEDNNVIIAISEKSNLNPIHISNDRINLIEPIPIMSIKKKNVNYYSQIIYSSDGNIENLQSLKSATFKGENQYSLGNKKKLRITNSQNELIRDMPLTFTSFCVYNFQNKILIGTQNGLKILVNDSIIEDFILPNIDISNYRIQDINSKDDILILSTRGDGVFLLTEDFIVHKTEQKGLTSNTINHSLVHNDLLWIATNKGVNVIDLSDASFDIKNKYSKESGLINNDVLQIITYKDEVYLGMDNGISKISLEKEEITEQSLHLYIDKILVNDTFQVPNIDESIEFLPYENYIEFSFLGINQNFNSKLLYEYKLDGIDKSYNYTSSRKIKYNSLPPGKYTFIVRAKEELSEWTGEFESFNFLIKKRIWQTNWFRILAFIFSSLLTYSIVYFILCTFKRRKNYKKQIKELKQQSLNAQMNPHFVFNSLNSIQNFILKNDRLQANKYLVKFSKLIRLILDQSNESHITLQEEIEASTLYLELESLRLNGKFQFAFDIDPNVNINQTLIPSLLIQPFLENSVWHGIMPKEGNGWINIRLKTEMEKLIVEIEDNGIGRKEAAMLKENSKFEHESVGMRVTKKRLDLFNRLKKNNYKFTIEDILDEENNGKGTKITFTIPLFLKI